MFSWRVVDWILIITVGYSVENKWRHEGGSAGERSWGCARLAPWMQWRRFLSAFELGLPQARSLLFILIITCFSPPISFLIASLCQPACVAALRGANRPLMHRCQRPMPGVPGSWHSHSTQTQSTKSHCGLIGSSSCGNQFALGVSQSSLDFCVWVTGEEKGKRNELKWHSKKKKKSSSCDLNVTLTSNSGRYDK